MRSDQSINQSTYRLFLEYRGSLSSSQELFICSYPVSNKSIPDTHAILKIHFNIIVLCRPTPPKYSPPFWGILLNFVCISFASIARCMYCSLHTRHIFLVFQFSLASCHILVHGSKHSPQHPLTHTIQRRWTFYIVYEQERSSSFTI